MTNSSWTVILQRRAQKAARRLPESMQNRLAKAFPRSEEDQYLGEKLVDEPLYNYRVGDVGKVYSLKEDRLIVLVVDVGARGDIYRRLRRL